MIEIECAACVENELGEGPWWDATGRRLWRVDAWRARVWCLDPRTAAVESHALPPPIDSEPIGSMVLDSRGRLVLAMRRDFWRVDLGRGEATPIAPAEHDRPASNRLNDGKCDRRGRFWCGSLNTDWSKATGALYRLGADRVATRVVDEHGISNGIAFSPDDRRFYLADSLAAVVWQYDFDLEAGALSNRRVFVDGAGVAGMIDGATVDADGFYWCAMSGAGAVARFDPDGRPALRVELPTRDVTMCTFGGPDLETLYVTSARRFLEPGQLAGQPLAGALFAIRGLGTRGIAEPRFVA